MANILTKVTKAVVPRIGQTEKERLGWVINVALAQENGPKTPGDWQNLQLYIAVFIYLGRRDVLEAEGDKVDTPSREEAEEILREWGKTVRATIERKRIPIVPRSNEELIWHQKAERYVRHYDYDETWLLRAMRPLVDMVETHGHLIKQCQAPALRAKGICGKWFVADRPNQDHCTKRCRSRASTKAKRGRDLKAKRRKPK